MDKVGTMKRGRCGHDFIVKEATCRPREYCYSCRPQRPLQFVNERRREKQPVYWPNIESRARREGAVFAVSIARQREIQHQAFHGLCDLTGFRFDLESGSLFYPSVDRIDPRGGYTDHNIRLVINAANMMRGACRNDDALMSCIMRAILNRAS